MSILVPLNPLIRFVPPHRIVPGKPGPAALCVYASGSAATGFRYVTLCRPPTPTEPRSVSHCSHQALPSRQPAAYMTQNREAPSDTNRPRL
jgi:hypothetical protein